MSAVIRYLLPNHCISAAMRQQTLTTMLPVAACEAKVHALTQSNTLHVARNCLQVGQVIALPTDTVYGLACGANNEAAIQSLYRIKGRDFFKPVAICVKNHAALRRYGQSEHLSEELLQRLLPGPLTIVLERTSHLSNRYLNPSTNKIGIRIPDFEFIQQLCAIYEQPLALTSANKSAAPSSLNVQEFSELWPCLGAIFDAGQLGVDEKSRSASTVVDLTVPGYYSIIREGVAIKSTLELLQHFGLKDITA